MLRLMSVAVDELGHDASESLNTQEPWSDIEEKNISHVPGKHATLDVDVDGGSFIGVNTL